MATEELTRLPIENAPKQPAADTSSFGTATPINSTTLSPRESATLAEPRQATQMTGMQAEFEDATNSFTQNLQAQAQALEAPVKNGLDSYLSQLRDSRGQTALTAEAYRTQGGVDSITPELNDINDRIRREQLALRRRTEAIQKNGGGLASGAAAEIQNLERESFAKQADLSIIQMAVQGRYDSAKEIADRAVAAKLEQQTNDLAIAKFNYDENKERFTKAEQRAFEAQQADRERKLETDRQNAQSIYELGIQAIADGAPSAVVERMLQAKTREQALALGGSYIGALDRQAKQASIANIYDQIASRQTALREAALQAASEEEKVKLEKIAQTDSLLETQKLLSDIAAMPGFSSAVGVGFKKTVVNAIPFVSGDAIAGTNRADFEILATRLSDMFLVQNLDKMTGVLTDKDLEVLRSEGTTIGNFDQSEESWMREKNRLDAMIQRGIAENGITTEQATFWGVLDTNDADTFNSIWETL